jgi:hypothetical protein
LTEHPDFQLHTLGWRSFQDLCATLVRETFGQEAQFFGDGIDGGQDGSWRGSWTHDSKRYYTGSFTFQCKFSSSPSARFSLHDIKPELAKIATLAERSRCDNYFLLTNCRVSPKSHHEIEDAVREAGARECLVFDREWITSIIRDNRRLRFLVPRIYGLGNITDFFDGDALTQSQAILSYLSSDLKKLVVTGAHRQASEALLTHGFVMLLGAPRVGKSIIAATLALAALDTWKTETYLVRSVDEIVKHWHPDQPKQFFWLDDAFGTNQVQTDRVDDWNRASRHLVTAINGGALVVCTSRLHLFRNALPYIKSAEMPLLKKAEVLVEVEQLSVKERENILYNHIKLGSSNDLDFRRQIKPHLHEIARHPLFAPELARWLGDETLRSGIAIDRPSLLRFIGEPIDHLMSVMRGLDKDSFAALGVLFVSGGNVSLSIFDTDKTRGLVEALGSSRHLAITAMSSLEGSFVRQTITNEGQHWSFRHPTMRDAYGKLVAENPALTGLYLAGSTTMNLLREVVCWGVALEGATIALEPQYYDVLLERLLSVSLSEQIEFIVRRSNAAFATIFLDAKPNIFEQAFGLQAPTHGPYELLLRLSAACAHLGVLTDEMRERWSVSARSFLCDQSREYLDLLLTPHLNDLLLPADAEAVDDFAREEVLGRLNRILELRVEAYDGDLSPAAYLDDIRDTIARIEVALSLDQYEQRVIDAALKDVDYWEGQLKERYIGRFDDDGLYERYRDDARDDKDGPEKDDYGDRPAARDVFEDVDA